MILMTHSVECHLVSSCQVWVETSWLMVLVYAPVHSRVSVASSLQQPIFSLLLTHRLMKKVINTWAQTSGKQGVVSVGTFWYGFAYSLVCSWTWGLIGFISEGGVTMRWWWARDNPETSCPVSKWRWCDQEVVVGRDNSETSYPVSKADKYSCSVMS